MSRSGARVQAEPSRVPPASWVMGGRLWPGLSVPATPCCSSNTYQFVPSRCFLSMNIIPLSEKQIFLFPLYIKGDKGERKEKIHLPPQPTCACISQGATFWMWEGVDFSIFPTWLLKPSFLVLLLVSQFITKWQNDHVPRNNFICIWSLLSCSFKISWWLCHRNRVTGAFRIHPGMCPWG